MTCLDLAQYVVNMMSPRVQSDKLPGFYIKLSLLFEFPWYLSCTVENIIKYIEKTRKQYT